MSTTSSPGSRTVVRRTVALLLFGVALYYAVWGGEYSVFDLQSIRQRQETEATRIELARAHVDSLRELTTRLENDPATIEAVARERFGMIRPGEVLYRFVQVDSAAVPAPPAPGARAPGAGTAP